MQEVRRDMGTMFERRPLALDLFSGAGGLSRGFEDAGFQVLYALEKDKYAAETYQRNRDGGTVVDVADILDVRPADILAKLGMAAGDLDIVLGGPPCQGFSIANMQTRNRDNPLNELVFRFWDFVKALMPKWFVMENVGGLEKFANGSVKQELLQLFEGGGYNAGYVVLNACCFGVPQVRRRLFFVGNRVNRSLDFLGELAAEKMLLCVTIREAIDDLPLLSNGNSLDPLPYAKDGGGITPYQRIMRLGNGHAVSNNLVSMSSPLAMERYKCIEQGENWMAVARKRPDLLYNYRDLTKCHHWIYLRLSWDKPSVVISNYRKNMLIHPAQDRGLSVREAARLQSFRDTYTFYGPLGYQQQQVANAVPPRQGKRIAACIKQLL